MPGGILAIKRYPGGTEKEISKVADWLRGSEALYSEPTDTAPMYCTNKQRLDRVSDNLLEMFISAMSFPPHETIIGAIRFEEHFRIVIPKGWQADLIPVHRDGEVKVVDQAFLDQTDVGQTDVGQTDVGQTDVGQTDVGQTDVGQTDIGQTDVGQTDVGQTDVDQAFLDQTDVGQTDIGEKIDSEHYARLGSDANVKILGSFFGLLFMYRFGREGQLSLGQRISGFLGRVFHQ
ncbi:hypothetical protein F5B22DRAFT_180565 [Xylaria bambusicola]|uniref:uncharacterized protein n=1 Tax=Xylaria bambusicola TaxID=326684 RepID=UPI002007D668|nr:uncharacterized protein F5B22DRAFT_180565 [Xylaria bambusicola]KAI0516783.1 hypothetical protein F5B22DRAFT_180565 [Xylaria bambusicola]